MKRRLKMSNQITFRCKKYEKENMECSLFYYYKLQTCFAREINS